jgi:hypothetical protein
MYQEKNAQEPYQVWDVSVKNVSVMCLFLSFQRQFPTTKSLQIISLLKGKKPSIPVHLNHATGTNSKTTLFLNKQESKNKIFVCESAINNTGTETIYC